MADLIVNGNIHKNKDYVRFHTADGKIAVFYDSARKDQRQPYASVTSMSGKPMVILSAKAESGIPTANVVKEI